MANFLDSCTEALSKAGYKEGQLFVAHKGKAVLSETEQKVVDKIRSINGEIAEKKHSISTLEREVAELEKKKLEWQLVCPHPSQSIQYGPQGDKPKPEIESASCCVCGKDILQETLAEFEKVQEKS